MPPLGLDYTETFVRVNSNSTIRVAKMTDSVPSKLIGSRLKARVYENRILLLDGHLVLWEMPRQIGDRIAVIDFRHVIDWLVRKPHAFAAYRWRESMFPEPVYRATYEHLCRQHDMHWADVHDLEILRAASLEGVSAVGDVLDQMLSTLDAKINAQEVTAMLDTYRDLACASRHRPPLIVSLLDYDTLLAIASSDVWRC